VATVAFLDAIKLSEIFWRLLSDNVTGKVEWINMKRVFVVRIKRFNDIVALLWKNKVVV
jgi:hypothetical protein